MSSEYFFFYTEANLVCCILFAVILIHDLRRFNRQEKQIRFDYAVASHILYFISDSFWAALVSGALKTTRLTASLVNFSNYFLMALLGFTWFHFMAASEQLPIRDTKKGRIFIAMPMTLMTLILVLWYIAAPEFWLSDSGVLNPLYFPMLAVSPFLYFVASMVFSVIQMRKRENRAMRHHYLLIGLYPIMIAVAGLLQLLTLTAPVFCFGCAIMMLYFYIQTLEDQISIDPLTKLNNKGELMRYMSQDSNMRQDGLRTFVVMVDANDFKFINDTYGHAEGDRALVIIANSLKRAIGSLHLAAFLGRYGGDEFILIVHAKGQEELEDLCVSVRRRLTEACKDNETPYRLTVGIGYDELEGEPDSFAECMKRADVKLYTDKRLQKQLRAVI